MNPLPPGAPRPMPQITDYSTGVVLGCPMGCEPQLRDAADTSLPTGVKIVAGLVVLLGIVTVVNWTAKRR